MQEGEIAAIVKRCSFEPWQIVARVDHEGIYLQVRDDSGTCNETGKAKSWGGRKWRLSEHMTETEIVKTALNAVLAAVTHEALETFKYEGVDIFNPHISVGSLMELRLNRKLDARREPGS
jgi:hypothetical protein